MSTFDLPGVDPASIDLTVEQNVLAVKAERPPIAADGAELIVSERPAGTFTRQLFLGETLDADHIEADYDSRGAHPHHPGHGSGQAPQARHNHPRGQQAAQRQRRPLDASSRFEPAGGPGGPTFGRAARPRRVPCPDVA